MQFAELRFREGFEVALTNRRAQAATMVLAPGVREGGADNRHEADQWMYVVSGEGTAVVENRQHALAAGVLLLIECGEAHEIQNTGHAPLRTLNLYLPPAYSPNGDPLPAAEG